MAPQIARGITESSPAQIDPRPADTTPKPDQRPVGPPTRPALEPLGRGAISKEQAWRAFVTPAPNSPMSAESEPQSPIEKLFIDPPEASKTRT
ncbi:MAG: hypothetical protein NT069_15830 [Planctomycetota bacterium]|nr:hypothetical protein [Planctomycetota bacterium]